MTQVYLPLWALFAIPLAAVAATLIVGLVAAYVARRGAKEVRTTGKELDTWRQREETMRMLRWAADHAIKFTAPAESEMGQAALDALKAADLLQQRDLAFVAAVADSIVAPAVDEYDEEDEFVIEDEPADDQEPL